MRTRANSEDTASTLSTKVRRKVLHRRARADLTDAVAPPATARTPDRPNARKQCQRLTPWLELANLACKSLLNDDADPSTTEEVMGSVLRFFAQAVTTPDFPADEIRRWFHWSRTPADQTRYRGQLFNLAIDVARGFIYCLGEDEEAAFAFEGGPRFGTRLYSDNGFVRAERFDPYNQFFRPAIEGIELARIRRCPGCQNIFFAIRYKAGSDFGSKACSRLCNQKIRVRRWRANQDRYRNNRKDTAQRREKWRKLNERLSTGRRVLVRI